MTVKELKEKLKEFPDDLIIEIVSTCCARGSIMSITYIKDGQIPESDRNGYLEIVCEY